MADAVNTAVNKGKGAVRTVWNTVTSPKAWALGSVFVIACAAAAPVGSLAVPLAGLQSATTATGVIANGGHVAAAAVTNGVAPLAQAGANSMVWGADQFSHGTAWFAKTIAPAAG